MNSRGVSIDTPGRKSITAADIVPFSCAITEFSGYLKLEA